jgi:hypothetical protein
MNFPKAARVIAGLAVVIAAGLGSAHALVPCETPFAYPGDDTFSRDGVSFYSAGSSARVGWEAGSSGGFRVERSISDEIDTDTGSFAVEPVTVTTTASKRQKLITGLEERAYYYHVQAKANTSCSKSAWSNVVQITQDATAPSVAFTTSAPPIGPVTPPVPIFTQSRVRLEGRATDEPAPLADTSSGARFAVVIVQDTTPVIGSGSEPVQKVAFVDTDGSWLVDIDGLGLGTYTASAIAIDVAGNQPAPDAEQVTFSFIVVAP